MKIVRLSFLPLFTIIILCASISAAAQANPPVTFRQLTKLIASDGAANDEFGYSVAMGGSILVAGAPQYGNGGTGKAYVFAKSASGGWSNAMQIAELSPSNGAPGLGFGAKVVISGSTIVVADSPAEGQQSGEYVFVEPEGGWTNMTETAELSLPNGNEMGNVAVAGNTVVAVGFQPNSFESSLYVFVKPRSGWTSNAKPRARLSVAGGIDNLGYALAFDKNTVVATTPNSSAYVFVEPSGGWVSAIQTATLSLSHETGSDEFGASVALRGGTILVGAPETGLNQAFYGEAYLFYEPTNGWVDSTESGEILAPNSQSWLFFGNSVEIGANLTAIGAEGQDTADNRLVGAVYVFEGTTQIAELTPSDGQDDEFMGASVAASGTTFAAGANDASVGSNIAQGKVYIFGR